MNTIKRIGHRIKTGLLFLSQKDVNFPNYCVVRDEVSEKELSYFTLSANTITILDKGDESFFFREVSKHKGKKEYCKEQFTRFMKVAVRGVKRINFAQEFPVKTQFSQSYVDGFSSWLVAMEKRPGFYARILNCNTVLEKEGFSLWEGNERQVVGEDALISIGLQGLYAFFPEIAPLFLSYCKGFASTYRLNKRNKYECFSAQKSISSYLVAKALNKEELISLSIPAQLIIDDGSILYGVMSSQAPGIRAMDSSEYPTPVMQRDLASLSVLDYLCCQPDHKPNNYNVVQEGSSYENSICAFDNDNQLTFFPVFNPRFFKQYWFSKFINKNGTIDLPHLDESFARTLLNTDNKMVSQGLAPWLNRLQIMAFNRRFKLFKKALKRTIENKESFLLKNEEWNEMTIQEELNGEFGNTYFKILYNYIMVKKDSL